MNTNNNQVMHNKLCLGLTALVAILITTEFLLSCVADDPVYGNLEPNAPNPPRNFLSITNENTSSTLSLSWEAPSPNGADHYRLYQKGITGLLSGGNIRDTGYTVSGLLPNTEYSFDLMACKDELCSATNSITVTTPPGKPTYLTTNSVEATAINISWVEPEGTTYYILKQKDVIIPPAKTAGATKTNQFTIEDLNPDFEYSFSLQACHTGGCSDPADLTATTGVVPSTPTGVTPHNISSSNIGLKWDSMKKATAYQVVYTHNSVEMSNQVKSNTFTANGLTAGSKYTFKIGACNSYGCSLRTNITFTTAPNPPANLIASDTTSSSTVLSWDTETGASEYVIYQDSTPIATNATTSYTVMNLKFANTYSFFVRACNSGGCSDASTEIPVTTSDAPDFFTISYSNMDSTVSVIRTPTIVSGKNCDLQAITSDGKASYTISTPTTGTTPPVLPTIDPNSGAVNNRYASPGVYQVTVTVPEKANCDTKVLIYNTITPADKDALTTAIKNGVYRYGNLGNFNYIITSQITDMSSLFSTKDLFNGDISEWDTSQVTRMNGMFFFAAAFNQPVGNWNTEKVTRMNAMFKGASAFDQPLSNWDTSQVRDMNMMFSIASAFDQSLSNWDTSQVQNMNTMFENASAFNQPLNGWDTSQVRDMSSMFQGASKFNQTIGGWKTSNVTRMDNMFHSALAFNRPIGDWDTSKVTNMGGMFRSASNFNQPLIDWDTSQVTRMDLMFVRAVAFDRPLSNWNTSQVVNMASMFDTALSFNQPLSNWNTSKVQNMNWMFYGATQFDQDLSGWNVTNVTSHDDVFKGSAMEGEKTQYPDPNW